MLSNIVMKNLLFAAWKNSSRPKIGQFEKLKALNAICFVMLLQSQDFLPPFLSAESPVFVVMVGPYHCADQAGQ